MRSRRTVTIYLALLAAVISCVAHADEKPDVRRDAAAKNERLIDVLHTTNKTPELVNPGIFQRAKFALDFDWKENDRVVNSIKALESNVIEAWPEIVHHMTDDEYCITVLTIYDSEITSNRSRGDVCFRIVKNSLNRLYIGSMPGGAPSYQMQVPADGPVELQKWCQARSEKTLEELQIEAAEWAISIIPKTSSFPSEYKEQSIAEIRKRIAAIKENPKPKTGAFFVRDEVIPYSESLVERQRKRREATEEHK